MPSAARICVPQGLVQLMATTSVPKPELEEKSFDSTLESARTTMVFSEIASLAVDSFRASKARFLLTMLGMVIGSASIILVVTVGLTGKQYALDAISSLGPNKIEMQYSGGSIIGPDNTTTPDYMTREDMQAVVDPVPGIVAYSPMLEDHDPISVGGGITKDSMLLGVSPQYKEVRGLIVITGRFFDDQDAAATPRSPCSTGRWRVKLFGSPQAAVGQNISINGIPLTIIGVFQESIDTFGQSEINDDTILIPYEVARYFTGTDNLKEIFFKMATSSMVEPGAERDHRAHPEPPPAHQRLPRPDPYRHPGHHGKITDDPHLGAHHRRRHHPDRQRRRHHEQHAGQCAGPHPRDRHPQGAGRHPPRDPPAVPHRGGLPLALRRHHRHPPRPRPPPLDPPADALPYSRGLGRSTIALATSVVVGVVFGTVPPTAPPASTRSRPSSTNSGKRKTTTDDTGKDGPHSCLIRAHPAKIRGRLFFLGVLSCGFGRIFRLRRPSPSPSGALVTSRCSLIGTWNSPSVFSGSSSEILRRSMV